jgi:hypothetical protein
MVVDVHPPADAELSLTERRPRRMDCQLPKCFQDVVPQPQPPLAREDYEYTLSLQHLTNIYAAILPALACLPSPTPDNILPALNRSLPSRLLQYFRTPRNIFGLSRQYYSAKHPCHDPEEILTLQDLSNSRSDINHPLDDQSFYPYPNETSFHLGDWYWNLGVQKSQNNFQELV